MARVISIGRQDFEKMRLRNNFYIDKTDFIREWWESDDDVTLITRPRRFGKTLNMCMLEQFFSIKYAGRGDLFEGLSIWEEKSPEREILPCGEISSDGETSLNRNYKYRQLQGTWPVIALSFAKVKETSYLNTRKKICHIISCLYNQYDFLLNCDKLSEKEKQLYQMVSADMEEYIATDSLNVLSDYLRRYYGKKVIILLDEYDTPMHEAYVHGFWEEEANFIRGLFNATFKTNPNLERALLTGITRISKESIFSDLNNLKVVTTTSEKYADCFGFTEEEVFTALEEYGLSDRKEEVKQWYDGFSFGKRKDIYNPWSVINFLEERKAGAYWANTSNNSLAGKLIQEGSPEIKMTMERLLRGEAFHTILDEQIVFNQLDQGDDAVWSLLLASGYLKVVHYEFNPIRRKAEYDLKLTNLEVQIMFEQMIAGWFGNCRRVSNAFLQALLADDVRAMNTYMNRVALQSFSYFDTGKNPSWEEPERFYHGFVLGMMVELADRYVLTSNRESGFGRYDVMLEPKEQQGHAIIMEFKVQDTAEKELSDTVREALRQIEERNYQANLEAKGYPEERIRKYGFAFSGKTVLIGSKAEYSELAKSKKNAEYLAKLNKADEQIKNEQVITKTMDELLAMED